MLHVTGLILLLFLSPLMFWCIFSFFLHILRHMGWIWKYLLPDNMSKIQNGYLDKDNEYINTQREELI